MELSRKNEHAFFGLCKINVPLAHPNLHRLDGRTLLRIDAIKDEGKKLHEIERVKQDWENQALRTYTRQINSDYDNTIKEIYDNSLLLDSKQRNFYLNDVLKRTEKELHELNQDIDFREKHWAKDQRYLYKFEFIYRHALSNLHDLIKFLNTQLQVAKGAKPNVKQDERSYSLRQVCIAYHFMGGINEDNAAKLLKAHTRFESVAKLMAKRIKKPSDLTQLSENKTADKKKLKDLLAAKRLISGKKNNEALKHITHTITQFQTALQNNY